MPLASIVSALGMWTTGQITYPAGRLPFVLLSACVPLLTAALAYDVTGKRWLAIVSGLLSVFSLYYAPFMPVPDNYALYMILGSAFLLLAARWQNWIPIVLGVLAGVMTLARSDGLLWLGIAGLTVMWKFRHEENESRTSFKAWLTRIVPAGLLVIVGYLVVMGPWHLRNQRLFDTLLTPGGERLLWLQSYNETFIYPAEELNRESFLRGGWELAMQNRVGAFISNLSNAFAAQGGIFLFPFMLIGIWQLRAELRAKIAVTGWLILFAVMTIIFPFAGSRGSFFHAGAAFQPYWWVAAPVGLEAVVAWARKRGQFTDANAPYVFQGILVLLAVFMTGYLVNIRVIENGWARDDFIYPDVEQMFLDHEIGPEEVVIVRNPPGYFIASGRSAIALPFGDESTILAVAERYDAHYLVVEQDGTFDAIQDLYDDPNGHSSFLFLGEIHEAKLYRIDLAR
jgi:hypothetical protein